MHSGLNGTRNRGLLRCTCAGHLQRSQRHLLPNQVMPTLAQPGILQNGSIPGDVTRVEKRGLFMKPLVAKKIPWKTEHTCL